MNKIFTLKTILKLAYLFNHNKLEFDTRFTNDEWTVIHKDSMMNVVELDNPIIGKFVFQRVRDTREYCLCDKESCTRACRLWLNVLTFVEDVINDLTLLDKFEK